MSLMSTQNSRYIPSTFCHCTAPTALSLTASFSLLLLPAPSYDQCAGTTVWRVICWCFLVSICLCLWFHSSVFAFAHGSVLQNCPIYFKLDISKLASRWTVRSTSQGKINCPLRGQGQGDITHFLNLGPLLSLEWIRLGDTSNLIHNWTMVWRVLVLAKER